MIKLIKIFYNGENFIEEKYDYKTFKIIDNKKNNNILFNKNKIYYGYKLYGTLRFIFIINKYEENESDVPYLNMVKKEINRDNIDAYMDNGVIYVPNFKIKREIFLVKHKEYYNDKHYEEGYRWKYKKVGLWKYVKDKTKYKFHFFQI